MIRSFDVVYENKDAVLFADDKAFYIAELHKELTNEQLNQLRLGKCTVAQMQEMGVSGTTIARGDIRGIAVEGYDRADELVFHLNSKKKLAILFSRHYAQEEADAFFKGLSRFQKAKGRQARRGRRHKDWHVREQDPQLRKRLKPIGTGLKWAACISALGFFWKPEWMRLWLILYSFWAVAAIGLLVVFEPYFTLMDSKEYRQAGYSAQIIELSVFPFLPLGLMLFGLDRYTLAAPGINWAIGGIAAAVLTLVLWILLREFQENPMHMVAFCFAAVVLCTALVGHVNHYFAWEEMTSCSAQVVDKDKSSGRRHRDYDLTVVLEDGRELILDVGSGTYEQTEVGDTVSVDMRTGALGIEYAILGGYD